jgi:hypothetical protein
MKRFRVQFIAGVALCGVLITMLSFAPWVRFESIEGEGITPDAPKASVSVAGTHISRSRDEESLLANDVENVDGWCSCRVAAGDGYLTAGLGVLVAGFACAALVSRKDRLFAMAAVSASVAALGLAAYNGLAEWNAYVWTNLQNLEVTEGTVQPGLIALVVVAMAAAVLAGLLWGAGAEEMHDERLAEEEEWDQTGPPSQLALRLRKIESYARELGA